MGAKCQHVQGHPAESFATGFSLEEAAGRPADAKGVVGGVDPVVEAPDESGLLVFEVSIAPKPDAGIEMLTLVRNTVVVGVGPLDHVV